MGPFGRTGRVVNTPAAGTTGVQLDYSKLKRDPEYEQATVHYATPGGERSAAGLATVDTVEEESVAIVVERDDTTTLVPFGRVIQLVADG